MKVNSSSKNKYCFCWFWILFFKIFKSIIIFFFFSKKNCIYYISN